MNPITDLIWLGIARIVTIPRVTGWLMQRAVRTPYTHIHGPDGSLYMGRWWLFNPYPGKDDSPERARFTRSLRGMLPSIRIHHICRPDSDSHCHDHPWNARTIILRGWYVEERPGRMVDGRAVYVRGHGYTGRLLFGQFHRIASVSPEGVWTLFITWRKQGTWGFDVDGKKVPWREYLGEQA